MGFKPNSALSFVYTYSSLYSLNNPFRKGLEYTTQTLYPKKRGNLIVFQTQSFCELSAV